MSATRRHRKKDVHGNNATGPGRHLRDARLAAEITIEELADDLHLDMQTVQQLEADDYTGLSAPIFARGYLRSYARALDLPPAPILEAFDNLGLRPPPLTPDVASKTQARSSDLLVRMTTITVVAVLIGLVAWWQQQRVPPPPLSAAEAGAKTLAELTAPSAGVATPSTRPSPLPTTRAPELLAALKTETSEPGVLRQAATLEPAIDAAPAVDETGRDSGTVSIRFKHDSWLEAYDGDGKRLHYNLVRKGKTLELRGVEPMRVLIGYARDLSIQYNGRLFDYRPYVDSEIARFTLGGSEKRTN